MLTFRRDPQPSQANNLKKAQPNPIKAKVLTPNEMNLAQLEQTKNYAEVERLRQEMIQNASKARQEEADRLYAAKLQEEENHQAAPRQKRAPKRRAGATQMLQSLQNMPPMRNSPESLLSRALAEDNARFICEYSKKKDIHKDELKALVLKTAKEEKLHVCYWLLKNYKADLAGEDLKFFQDVQKALADCKKEGAYHYKIMSLNIVAFCIKRSQNPTPETGVSRDAGQVVSAYESGLFKKCPTVSIFQERCDQKSAPGQRF